MNNQRYLRYVGRGHKPGRPGLSRDGPAGYGEGMLGMLGGGPWFWFWLWMAERMRSSEDCMPSIWLCMTCWEVVRDARVGGECGRKTYQILALEARETPLRGGR